MNQLKIKSVRLESEILCDLLSNFGALSISLEDYNSQNSFETPIFVEPDWNEDIIWENCLITALFENDINIKNVLNKIKKLLFWKSFPKHSILPVEEKDWVKESIKDFKPIKIGKRLNIVPSWCKIKHPKEINVIFDPGLAFGTGKHPTTKMCLDWLEANIKKNESLLDYGCGSGILAIAALKLGCKPVVGVDIDLQAIESSKNNAIFNDVELDLYTPENEPNKKYDIIIANILANPLIQLAKKFHNFSHSKTKIILSGLLSNQTYLVINEYSKFYKMSEPTILDDWACLYGTAK